MINIIGPGRVGKTLFNCFKKKNISIKLFSKDDDKSNISGIVIITTQDEKIKNVWTEIKNYNIEAVGHCSGILDSNFFGDIPHFSMHPNFPFSSPLKCDALKNIVWGIEGNSKGIEYAKNLIDILDGKYVIIPQNKKVLYHLAAVIASNFSYGLIKMSKVLYNEIEIDNINHLIDLSIISLNNIKEKGLKGALTGPVSRNDLYTINKEREEFNKIFGNVEVYDFFIDLLYKIKEDE
ncbi:hypothetical protein X275_08385 [Marinitoga sp. 1197]|uniref:DUF2520 domain-containing protein n=1 Tax=Marinitoga sp. 1197 TaxID=1428449 RepID=UPI00065965B9|nr:DUF2520 domain-containing protein [Marinitoga sp. 1197]KLO21614.1 hypothetical protein X275_08385 [Marinitoga sp. 1197]